MLILFLAMQATPDTGDQVVFPNRDLDHFDLATAKPKIDQACGIDNPGGDIVVCARRKMMDIDTARMPRFVDKPVRSIVDLPGGGKVGIGTTAREVGGFPSNAIMGKVKIPF